MMSASTNCTMRLCFETMSNMLCHLLSAARNVRTRSSKRANSRSPFVLLAEWTGLEPATPGVTGRYSNQLNYHSQTAKPVRGTWWVLTGSNRRHSPCKGDALPAELSTRARAGCGAPVGRDQFSRSVYSILQCLASAERGDFPRA